MPTTSENHNGNGNGTLSTAAALVERERRLDRARIAPGSPPRTPSSMTRGASRGAAAKIAPPKDDTGPRAVGAWKAGLVVAALAFGALAWTAPREDAEAALETSLRSAPPADVYVLERGPLAPAAGLPALEPPPARGAEARPAAASPPSSPSSSPSPSAAACVSVLAERELLGSIASGEAPGQHAAASPAASRESRGEESGGDRSLASRTAPAARERPMARDPGAKRRTSVTVREEAPKPPPPKPSVIVEQPRALYKPKPTYPATAVKEGKGGFVRVRMLVSAQGTVEKHEILSAQPRGVFEDAVNEVIPRWTLVPAKDDAGLKVPCWMEYSFVFELKSGS